MSRHSHTIGVTPLLMLHVEILLEMMTQGKVEERALIRGQFHRCSQAALHLAEAASVHNARTFDSGIPIVPRPSPCSASDEVMQ